MPLPNSQPTKGSSRRRGLTLIDTLIATLIITVAMVGSVGIFFASSSMTTNTETNTVAESLARWSIEQAKSQGFDWCSTSTPGTENSAPCDGTTTAYYNNLGSALSSSTGATFNVVTSVVSNPAPVAGVVSQSALRTLTVTVTNLISGSTVLTTGTYLTWGGV